MKSGNKIVEQINENGEIIQDVDTVLSKNEIYNCLDNHFPMIRKENDLIVGDKDGVKYSILVKNITYLGNPHPTYKKRIQITGLIDFYMKSIEQNCIPLLLGIYKYNDNIVYCDFNIRNYLYKKSNNSSAHIYTDDIINAVLHGIFQKEDSFKNIITVFRPNCIKYFLQDKFENTIKKEDINSITSENYRYKHPCSRSLNIYENNVIYDTSDMQDILVSMFKNFFNQKTKKWNGIECYQLMIADNYKNKFQPEWAGFFLEFEFGKYIKRQKLEKFVKYNQDKTKNGIDLDLYFPFLNSFGDLKAHSSHSKAIQGNDWNTIFDILNSTQYNNHIYYIVCEHDTFKDKDYNYETTKFWNIQQGKDKIGKLYSYKDKMKHHVELKKCYILDINNFNSQYLKKFKQGVNSNGKLREPKIMIEHDNLDKFILKEFDL